MIQQRLISNSTKFFANNSYPVLKHKLTTGLFDPNLRVSKFIHYRSPISVSFLSNKNHLHLKQLYSTLVVGDPQSTNRVKLVENSGNGTEVEDADNTLLASVAKKTLNCQPSPSSTLNTQNGHIPFEVKTKNSSPDSMPASASADQDFQKSLKKLIRPYIVLTKPNLTFLVTLSAICSYVISPYSMGMSELVFLTVGTTLLSGAANLINMAREPEFDSKMKRTSMRPVVTGKVTPKQLFIFAGVTGTVGCTMLLLGVNSTVASLGFLNIILYSWIYTSLKRKSILNTWVGALVGAIPPLMGWAAASSLEHPGPWCLAALLYAWQFPHFNLLSHNIRNDYKNAGYVMTAYENPKLNARVALRYSLLMFPICYALTYFDVTDQYFPFDSAILTAWMSWNAYKFWDQQRINNRKGIAPTKEGLNLANLYAKKLFWASVWYLPGVLVLGMLHKKGQWDRFFKKDEPVYSDSEVI